MQNLIRPLRIKWLVQGHIIVLERLFWWNNSGFLNSSESSVWYCDIAVLDYFILTKNSLFNPHIKGQVSITTCLSFSSTLSLFSKYQSTLKNKLPDSYKHCHKMFYNSTRIRVRISSTISVVCPLFHILHHLNETKNTFPSTFHPSCIHLSFWLG